MNSQFWVIERYINNSMFYWSAGTRGKCSRDDWAPSIGSSTKFFDSNSAILVLLHSCGGEGHVVSHQFVEPVDPVSLAKGNGND
jgi:hypothetical protein